MKKINPFILLLTTITTLFLLSSSVFADDTWNGTDTTGSAWRSGKVGIGTAPAYTFDVGSPTGGDYLFRFGISGVTNGFLC